MLKKTGIIVSVAAAGVLGLGGLAFATSAHHEAPTNHSNVQSGNVGNDCAFGQSGPATEQGLTGGSGLLGVGGAVTGAVTPLTTQLQTGNCTNVSTTDVLDSDSNNTTRTNTRNDIVDSNNTHG